MRKMDDLRVPLMSFKDASYLGNVYLGAPKSQPAKVVFDTGSEYLIVTSVLCNDKSSGFKFKKWSPITHKLIKSTGPKFMQRCNTMAYNMHESTTAKKLSVASSKLVYGSAKILGFAWSDYTCINPLKGGLKKGQLKA